MSPCYVYAGKTVGAPHVKIGYARLPQRRMEEHQVSCPFPLALVAVMPHKDEGSARTVEKGLHRKFSQWRVRSKGEWFNWTDSVVTELKMWRRRWPSEQGICAEFNTGIRREREDNLWKLEKIGKLEGERIAAARAALTILDGCDHFRDCSELLEYMRRKSHEEAVWIADWLRYNLRMDDHPWLDKHLGDLLVHTEFNVIGNFCDDVGRPVPYGDGRKWYKRVRDDGIERATTHYAEAMDWGDALQAAIVTARALER